MASDVARQRATVPAALWPRRLGDGVHAGYSQVAAAASADWAGSQVLTYGAIVTFLACVVAGMVFLNNPAPYLPYHDSHEYIASAHRIMAGEAWADPQRLPGYPLFLALIFTLTGTTNLIAAELAQLALFILTTVEVYVISYRLWRHTRLAAVIGALFGTNVYFLEFAKPILSDGLALWLTTTLALAVILFVERPRVGRFWIVAALTLALFMTRAEWYLVPVPLFAYLLVVAHRHGSIRHILPHMLVALALLYAVMFGYIAQNTYVNGVTQLTSDENINLFGKVTQYNMQGEAPASFASFAHATGHVMSVKHTRDPWEIYWTDPPLGRNNFAQMGAYARAIIERHPVQFLGDSIPVAVNSLSDYYQFGGINTYRRLAKPLHTLLSFSAVVFPLFMLFPLCAAAWIVALLRRRRDHTPRRDGRRAEIAGALILLALYDLAVTTVGSYDEYGRIHLAFDPLMLIVVVGSIALFIQARRQRRSVRGAVQPPVAPPDTSSRSRVPSLPAA